MKVTFEKYSSIDNSYNEKYRNLFLEATHDQDEFVLQEKIHGTNFSFYCDGKNVKCAKRSSMLGENADFYGWQTVRDRYHSHVIDLFNEINLNYGFYLGVASGPIKAIVVYGEMFGGYYADPSVPQTKAPKIQKGVSYSPDLEFMAFDIKIVFDHEVMQEHLDANYKDVKALKEAWLSMKNLYRACEQVRLPTVPHFGFMSVQNALAKSPEGLNSKVPNKFGLPELEINNIEGFVLKPNRHVLMRNGSRAVLKIKAKKFLEKIKPSTPRQPNHVSEHLKSYAQEAMSYVTENRYITVTSKECLDPKYDIKCIGKVIGLFNKDVLEDFIKDNPDFTTLEKKDRQQISKLVNVHSAKFIKDLVFSK